MQWHQKQNIIVRAAVYFKLSSKFTLYIVGNVYHCHSATTTTLCFIFIDPRDHDVGRRHRLTCRGPFPSAEPIVLPSFLFKILFNFPP